MNQQILDNNVLHAITMAYAADRAWQSYLDTQRIGRWSPLSSDHGYCRELYQRKVAADFAVAAAFQAAREGGDMTYPYVYSASVFHKNGHTVFETLPMLTREEAVKLCFALFPQAKCVCSARSIALEPGERRRFGFSGDIRFHNNGEIQP